MTARLAMALFALMLAGCATDRQRPTGSLEYGRIYYVDGAGGDPFTSRGTSVRAGFAAAGFAGVCSEFRWQTGLGPLVDQIVSVRYKRDKARELAELIRRERRARPETPLHIMGFSAGTAVVVYALELLPSECAVDTVTLVASSLTAHYDLTASLQHVRKRVYIFVSPRDAVLSWLAPLTGSADRVYCGRALIGLSGCQPPPGQPALPPSYRKIDTVLWAPDFARAGHTGGHAESVSPEFVRAYIAPRLEDTAAGWGTRSRGEAHIAQGPPQAASTAR